MATYEFVNLHTIETTAIIKQFKSIKVKLTLRELEELEWQFSLYLKSIMKIATSESKKCTILELSAEIMQARGNANAADEDVYTLFLQTCHLTEVVDVVENVKTHNTETISIFTAVAKAMLQACSITVGSDRNN